MRRLTGLVLPALLALAVLAAPAAAADLEPGGEGVVLAAESEGGEVGPDPRPYDAEDNIAREEAGYRELDVPFTWGAAFIMLFLGAAGIALMAGLYWLLVYRPNRQKEGAGSR